MEKISPNLYFIVVIIIIVIVIIIFNINIFNNDL